jgi:hypothetical protein
MKRFSQSHHLVLAVFAVLLGLYLGGQKFVEHFHDGVPYAPVGGGVSFMRDGDHLQQLYRYSLVRHNLDRGHTPYFSGYQFALGSDQKTPHDEGWIFFPFSLLSALLGAIFGDTAAFNLMIVLSFVFAASGAYCLAYWVAGERFPAIIVSLWFSGLWMRTSFAFNELVFAVEVGLIPLIIYLFEYGREHHQNKVALAFLGLSVAGLAFANFGLLYWVIVLGSPYFIFRGVEWAMSNRRAPAVFVLSLWPVMPGLLLAGVNVAYVSKLISSSTLGGGQAYSEIAGYAPTGGQLLARYGGNEFTLYYGLLAIVAVLVLLAGWLQPKIRRHPARMLIVACTIAGVFGLLLSFGPNLKALLGFDAYRFIFDYVPGAKGTRTTGRFTLVAAAFFIPLLTAAVQSLMHFKSRILGFAVGIALLTMVVVDAKYGDASMSLVEENNRAWASLAGESGTVLGLPIDSGTGHKNAEFVWQSLRYNLRAVNGYSSFHSPEWRDRVKPLFDLNQGRFDSTVAQTLRQIGVRHVVVYQSPRSIGILPSALASLAATNHFRFKAEAAGVVVLEFLDQPQRDPATTLAIERITGLPVQVPTDSPLQPSDRLAVLTVPESHTATLGPVVVQVRVTNAGRARWSSVGSHPVKLAAYVLKANGEPVIEHLRFSLPNELGQGETATIEVSFPRPPSGDFRLFLDVIQEGVALFSNPDTRRQLPLKVL